MPIFLGAALGCSPRAASVAIIPQPQTSRPKAPSKQTV